MIPWSAGDYCFIILIILLFHERSDSDKIGRIFHADSEPKQNQNVVICRQWKKLSSATEYFGVLESSKVCGDLSLCQCALNGFSRDRKDRQNAEGITRMLIPILQHGVHYIQISLKLLAIFLYLTISVAMGRE